MATSGDNASDRPSSSSPPPLVVRTSRVADRRMTAMDNPLNYRFEAIRLASFANWLSTAVTPEALAATGFYYTGERDRVRCFACHADMMGWSTGDIPEEEHRRWSTRCPLLRGIPIGNVPIGMPDLGPVRRSRDVTGVYAPSYDSPPPYYGQVEYIDTMGDRLNGPDMHRHRRPAHPQFASSDARLNTFGEWPKALHPTGPQLAEAGFFYRGMSDKVNCYHCGGGLRNWDPTDDAWEQHAKWFPTCVYLWLVKGQTFINQVLERPMPTPPVEELRNLELLNCQPHTPAIQDEAYYSGNEAAGGPLVSSTANTGERSAPSGAAAENIAGPSTELSTESPEEGPPTLEKAGGPNIDVPEEEPVSKPVTDDEQEICKICFVDKIGVVFIPCGHVACGKCVLNLTQCAVCRANIILTMRIYLS